MWSAGWFAGRNYDELDSRGSNWVNAGRLTRVESLGRAGS